MMLVFLLIFRVRMHYGHPDVFDRVFHITRGGISKASRIINISEDIFSGIVLQQAGAFLDINIFSRIVSKGKTAKNWF